MPQTWYLRQRQEEAISFKLLRQINRCAGIRDSQRFLDAAVGVCAQFFIEDCLGRAGTDNAACDRIEHLTERIRPLTGDLQLDTGHGFGFFVGEDIDNTVLLNDRHTVISGKLTFNVTAVIDRRIIGQIITVDGNMIIQCCFEQLDSFRLVLRCICDSKECAVGMVDTVFAAVVWITDGGDIIGGFSTEILHFRHKIIKRLRQ